MAKKPRLVLRHRTPLRYPGGKQRLAPFVLEVLQANNGVGWSYAEPYAGGAGVAMELLCSDHVGHVYLNDVSVHVYSFWKTLLEEPEELCSKIASATMSIEEWKRHREVVRHPADHAVSTVGFSTFFLNRCNRSGILDGGVIGGLAQRGEWTMGARFPREALVARVGEIAKRARQITLTNLDAEAFIKKNVPKMPRNTLVYCDPPYYEKAESLYWNAYEKADHARLAEVIQEQLRRMWMVSYDGHPDILRLYRQRRTFRYQLHYSAIRAYSGNEMFAFSDDLVLPATSSMQGVAVGLRNLGRAA